MKKSYDHRSVANIDTCYAPNILGRGCFISLWRPVRTASALSGLLMRCLAPNLEDAIISSAHRCCRARVVRYCVAPEQRDRDRPELEPGNEGSIYMAKFFISIKQAFLESQPFPTEALTQEMLTANFYGSINHIIIDPQ